MTDLITPSSITADFPIVLGTVQLGLDYGVSNTQGMLSDEAAFRVLDSAWAGGIRCFDTARAYGASEARIGAWATKHKQLPEIVTKIPPLSRACQGAADPVSIIAEHFRQSCFDLQDLAPRILMLHSAQDFVIPGVREGLESLLREHPALTFGVSVYEPKDLVAINDWPLFKAVQLPANLLDFRFYREGVIENLRARDVLVFIRSVYLQGVLVMEESKRPPSLKALNKPITALEGLAGDLGISIGDLAIQTVLAMGSDVMPVIGAHSVGQIEKAIDGVVRHRDLSIPLNEIAAISRDISGDFIDPRLWKDTRS